MNTNEKAIQIAEKLGLNWEVKMMPLTYTFNNQEHVSPYLGVIRQDNGDILGNFTDNYAPVQNVEVIQALGEIAGDFGLEFAKGFSLKGGKKIMVQLENKNEVKIGNETIKKYVSALNSHDGGTCLMFGLSDKVMSCQNQFHLFKKSSSFKLRHTRKIYEEIALLKKSLEKVIIEQEKHYENYERFNSSPASKEAILKVINYITDTDASMSAESFTKEFGTRKFNLVNGLKATIASEMAQKGETMFGLFNGVTFYTNHILTESSKMDESIILGKGKKLNQLAYEKTLQLIS